MAKLVAIDDEAEFVKTINQFFTDRGFEVHVALTGTSGVELVEAHQPDLVLLDVMMPVKSGYEVCQRMRERADWRHIKIIMLTAKGRDVEMSKGLSIGADLYITKPFSTQELVAKINGLLEVGTT